MFHAWPVKIISDGRQLQTDVVGRKSGIQGQQQARQERQHGDALQDVQERDQARGLRPGSLAAQ